MAKTSPTQRSLKWARDQSWVAEVVERWVPGANIRKDLFSIIDIVALDGSGTVGIQSTSYSNVSKRVKKIADSDHIEALRKAGWKIIVQGWRKVGNKWTCRIVDCS